MKLKMKMNPFLNIPIGYCAIFFPPSVKTFLTSNPFTVIKQYDAISKNKPKNNIIDEMNIKIIIKTFVKLKAIFNLLIAIINIIIA